MKISIKHFCHFVEKGCKICYFPLLQDLQLVCCICKFFVTKFVTCITVKFHKDLLRILLGAQQNFAIS